MLVVDDNPDARAIFSTVLRQLGAVVSTAPTALGAARRLKHVSPDIVLTDLSMPRRDGLWLLDWIRERDTARGTHTPVLAVTARDDLYDTGDPRFDRCLVKPVPARELITAITALATSPAGATA